jgi:hypothetical protein
MSAHMPVFMPACMPACLHAWGHVCIPRLHLTTSHAENIQSLMLSNPQACITIARQCRRGLRNVAETKSRRKHCDHSCFHVLLFGSSAISRTQNKPSTTHPRRKMAFKLKEFGPHGHNPQGSCEAHRAHMIQMMTAKLKCFV